jgi:CxxC motif-containing protein
VVNPVRVLTTTVKLEEEDKAYSLLPVQTDGPIPKDLLPDAMKLLAKVKVRRPVKYNEPILKNILNSGVDVVATSEAL